jgi:hypothetical protein
MPTALLLENDIGVFVPVDAVFGVGVLSLRKVPVSVRVAS